MVTRYGMDEKIGHIVYEDSSQNHLGQNMSGRAGENSISDKTAEQIDSAIKSIVDNIYDQTLALLEKNRDLVEYCGRELLKQETLTENQLLEMTKNMYRESDFQNGS